MRIQRTFAVAAFVFAATSTIIVRATENQSNSNFDDIVSDQLKVEHEGDRVLLSRKRRYLTFPEGSSFQLVWDGIVGVVDYTNYLILGITLALAWELPSKPPSELAEDLNNRLEDGTLDVSRNDTVSNITYVHTKQKQPQHGQPPLQPNYIKFAMPHNSYYQRKPIFQPPMHHKYYYEPPQKDSYYRQNPTTTAWRRKDNYYYSKSSVKNPFAKWSTPQQRTQTSTKIVQYPWWNLPARISSTVRRPNNSVGQQKTQSKTHYYQQNKTKPPRGRTSRQHRIYPIFGKRSIPDRMTATGNSSDTSDGPQRHHRQKRHGIDHQQDELSKLERIHIRHHRRTRHTLYGKIESYMDKFGQNGHHCVLRALCETGQKSHEHEPSSFVGELLRAVFTMPEPVDGDRLEYKEQRYDAANAYSENCAARYHRCAHSMWQSPYVM